MTDVQVADAPRTVPLAVPYMHLQTAIIRFLVGAAGFDLRGDGEVAACRAGVQPTPICA